jgi:glycosyltransferase involved in cell wall biosynthesis
MRILYECDLAGSKFHGMAYRIFQFSKEFIKRGHEVMIVAASFSHLRIINPNVKKNITDEIVDGIKYRWLKTPSYYGNGAGRIYHMLVYNYRLWSNAKRIIKDFHPDVVIASGVTPLDFIGCNKIANIAKAKKLIEVGDLWPLTPMELAGYSKFHPYILFMQWAENYAYKNADAVISLLPCAKEYMVAHGLSENKFHYIPNGIVLDDWQHQKPIPSRYKDILEKLKHDMKMLVCYSGNHGVANSLTYIIDAVASLVNENIVLILIGNGQEKNNLIDYVNNKGIKNVYFFDPITKSSIPAFLTYMDILFIGLIKQPLFRFGISPNKIYDYMMSAKPIIQSIDAGNNIVKEANCGIYVEPENSFALAEAIMRLQSMTKEELKILGENGYRFVNKNHNYDTLTDHFIKTINN